MNGAGSESLQSLRAAHERAFAMCGQVPSDGNLAQAMRATADLFAWCADQLRASAALLGEHRMAQSEALKLINAVLTAALPEDPA